METDRASARKLPLVQAPKVCCTGIQSLVHRAAGQPLRSETLMRRQLVWALLLVVASFGIASAQETTTGSITGTVVDAQGAPVPGATVTVTSPQGPKTFVSDTNGRFFA